MRINNRYKLRQVARENVILIQGVTDGDMTKVIAFNNTSTMLWNEFKDREFEQNDVAQYLFDTFDVDAEVAKKDANEWIDTLVKNNLIV